MALIRRSSRLAVLAALILTLLALAQPASAATSFTLISLSATVSGSSVTVSTSVRASVPTTANLYGVCARSSSGADVDFPLKAATISTTGTSYTATAAFAAGTVTYFTCVQVGGTWSQVGATKSFTVAGSTSTTAAPSGVAMPVGDLPGWKQVVAEDFRSNVALGLFTTSAYRNRFFPYTGTDTYQHGKWNADKVNSVSGGVLNFYLHKENGTPYSSALVAMNPTTNWGQKYGRYVVRFRSDSVPGYKMAFLLWPDTDNWGEGEIDFPEASSLEASGTGNRIYANLYPPGNLQTGTPGASTGFTTQTYPASSGWHTATTEWSPGRLTFILDGVTLGTKTSGVPTTSMHWVLQVETSIGGPAATSTAAGNLQVDWTALYTYTG